MWSELSVRHLLALRAVAEEGTFGRAATRLGFTQSAVSQQVASLEALVGQPLFDRPRGPNPPRLTAAGELLLEHAVGLIEGVEQAERALDRFSRGVSGRLTIGTYQSISARLLPATLGRLHQEAADIELTLVEQEQDQDLWRSALDEGELDLAFVVGPVGDEFGSRYLGADPHVAMVGADHPPGPVELADLSGQPLVAQPADDVCGILVDQGLERLGVSPHFAFRSHDNGAVQGMVGAGVGLAIVPLLTVDTNDPEISVRTTVPELEPRHLSIAWNARRTLAPIANRFIDIVAEVFAQHLASLPSGVNRAS